METILKLKSIQKSYGEKPVVNIETLNFNKGKITAIVGPSGSGKSTFLKIINGIEEPCRGSMEFDSELITFNKPISVETRRKMILVFQKSVLFNTTVYENIAYGLKIRGHDKKSISEKVMGILDLTGLKEKAHQRAATLSGGEAQRVAVARALVMEPKLILLDEPTSDLDPSNVSMIEKLVRHARDNVHTSVILVTHNMHQAKRLADNMVFIMDGQIVEAGSPDKLFNAPENDLTRAFINGEMVC